MAAKTKDGPPSHTDNAESWLEQLGLQASSMDPSSLEALADVLSGQRVDFFESPRGQDQQDDPTVATAAAASSSSNQNTNEVRGEAMAISPETRDMILAVLGVDQQQEQPSGQARMLPPAGSVKDEEEEEEEEKDIVIPEEATAVERLILEQLGRQSKMLQRLERRLDALKLDDRTNSKTRPAAIAVDPKQQRFLNTLYDLQQDVVPRAPAHAPPPPQPRVFVLPQVPARAGPPPVVAPRGGGGGAATVIASRFRKCFNLFVSLRRHQVPNERIDGWMLVKIMFMLSILLSKDQSKLFTTLTVVCLGFLWQSGLAGFLYKFIVRYNYVGRIILRDEDITFAAALAEQQGQPMPAARAHNAAAGAAGADAAAANAPEQRPAWYHADPNRHVVVNVLIDTVMIIGSLFLSIFPMWRVPDPPIVRDEPPPGAAANHPPEGNNINHHQQQQPQQEGAIPVVRPPVDPAAAADSDDDDDDHDGDDEDRDDDDGNIIAV